MNEDHIPFIGKPTSRWHVRSREWTRQPLLVKQLLFATVAAALLLPILYLSHLRHGGELSVVEDATATYPNEPAVDRPQAHEIPAFSHHGGVRPEVDDVIEPDDDASLVTIHVGDPPEEHTPPAQAESPHPVTFALIMWSENSASEGAILLKVRRFQVICTTDLTSDY